MSASNPNWPAKLDQDLREKFGDIKPHTNWNVLAHDYGGYMTLFDCDDAVKTKAINAFIEAWMMGLEAALGEIENPIGPASAIAQAELDDPGTF